MHSRFNGLRWHAIAMETDRIERKKSTIARHCCLTVWRCPEPHRKRQRQRTPLRAEICRIPCMSLTRSIVSTAGEQFEVLTESEKATSFCCMVHYLHNATMSPVATILPAPRVNNSPICSTKRATSTALPPKVRLLRQAGLLFFGAGHQLRLAGANTPRRLEPVHSPVWFHHQVQGV